MNRILQVFLALLAVFIVVLTMNVQAAQANQDIDNPISITSAAPDDFGTAAIENTRNKTVQYQNAQFNQAAKGNQAWLDSAMIDTFDGIQGNFNFCAHTDAMSATSGYKLLMSIQYSAGLDEFDLTSRAMTRDDENPVNLRSLLKCPIFTEASISGMDLTVTTILVSNKDSPRQVFSSNTHKLIA